MMAMLFMKKSLNAMGPPDSVYDAANRNQDYRQFH